MIWLLHLLVCDNKWIFKMHGATIKIQILCALLKCVHGSRMTSYVLVNNTMNTCIQLIRVPDIQIHCFSAGELYMYLYFTFTSSTPLTTHWNVFLTLTAISLTLSNKRHTNMHITQAMWVPQRVCIAHYKISRNSLYRGFSSCKAGMQSDV
jgi:hypothetical protein